MLRSHSHRSASGRRWALLSILVVPMLLLAGAAGAQPFGAWIVLGGHPTYTGHARIASSSSLNPTGAFTFEAWVSITNSSVGEDCRSIAGKNWQQAWWVGLCTVDGKPTLRSYLKGGSSSRNGGQIEVGRWTHVAVVFNGTQRLHYINGELAATFAEIGPLTTSTSEMRIGSDVSWAYPPTGAIDEVRLWNVARTQAQLRAYLSREVTAPEAGLVAVWPLNGNASDVIGSNDGSTTGTSVGFLTAPVALNCGENTATSLCLLDRFAISARWRTDPAGTNTNGAARVVNAVNNGSGLFWFFSAENWEILIKALNGCGLNERYWIFSAATTNVFYRVDVTDVRTGTSKIYFNYPGPPAPAVTDTSAFATCP